MKKSYFEKQLKDCKSLGTMVPLQLNNLLTEKKSSLFDVPLEKLVEEHFDEIISLHSPCCLGEFIQIFYNRPEYHDFILTKLDQILLSGDPLDLQYLEHATTRFENPFDIYEYLNNNFDKLMPNFKENQLLMLYKVPKISRENKAKIYQKFINEKNKLVHSLVDGNFEDDTKLEEKKEIENLLVKIIEEVSEEEHIEFYDVQPLNAGSFSIVLSAGNKVIKTGLLRGVYEIPNDERILQPVIRVNLNKFFKEKYTIEVAEKVNKIDSLTEDEQYAIYKELRERGIVYTDFKLDNLGRLIKENRIYWDKLISTDSENKGLKGNIKKVLQPGDIVIIDTDHLYTVKDAPDIFDWPSLKSQKFECRYRDELNNTDFIKNDEDKEIIKHFR